jgi:citrate lyase subunit beta/citryl-CoA lyase
MTRPLPFWRSLLYVPTTADRFVEGAASRGADAIILDLEDSVPAADKDRARALIPEAAARVSRNGADVVVRINRPLRDCVRDLEACVLPGIAALCLPKAAGPDHVRLLSELVGELEAERGLPAGGIRLVAMVETPAAVLDLRALAAADPRLVALTLGDEDFSNAIGAEPDADALLSVKQSLIVAAAAAGVLPLGFLGSISDYADMDAFRAMVRRSRRMGYRGACCIHPKQVAVLNEEFSPRPEEVERARRVVAAAEAALAEGRGAAALDGRMIDAPVVQRARALIAADEAILSRARG